jgi:hypothetical protein
MLCLLVSLFLNPTAVEPSLIASMAYSTWKIYPYGEKVLNPLSYSLYYADFGFHLTHILFRLHWPSDAVVADCEDYHIQFLHIWYIPWTPAQSPSMHTCFSALDTLNFSSTPGRTGLESAYIYFLTFCGQYPTFTRREYKWVLIYANSCKVVR